MSVNGQGFPISERAVQYQVFLYRKWKFILFELFSKLFHLITKLVFIELDFGIIDQMT